MNKKKVSKCCKAGYAYHSTCPIGEPKQCVICNNCDHQCETVEVGA